MDEINVSDIEGEVGKGKIFERIVYDFVTDCRNAIKLNDIQAFCNLVELFYANLVYSDKKTDSGFDSLRRKVDLLKLQNNLSAGPKMDMMVMKFHFAMLKYRLLCQLLKAKNLYPKPAESEDW